MPSVLTGKSTGLSGIDMVVVGLASEWPPPRP